MAATLRQIQACTTHKAVCALMGVPQSILRRRPVPGSPNVQPGGNVVWSGPGPIDPNAPSQSPTFQAGDQLVWAAFQPRQQFHIEIAPPGGVPIPRGIGQFPTIDDPVTQNAIVVAHLDWLIDPYGTIYNILNPLRTPGDEMWYFDIEALS